MKRLIVLTPCVVLRKIARNSAFALMLAMLILWATGPQSYAATWETQMARIVWVAYSPPSANPNEGLEATPEAIRADLAVLRQAGFTGLITYGADGIMGRKLPGLAEAQGFEGLIMGIWNPANQEELAQAQAAASSPILMGYCIGNEGLGARYEFAELAHAIAALKQATGKPVTTTEELNDYADDALLNLGDWIFPNVHPYFHSQLEPDLAVEWTKAAHDDFLRRTKRLVLFKEVGLPTDGDPDGRLSEANQDQYYRALAQTDVKFVYFEGFDQPWKQHLPIEPHWGVFRADRTPKLLAQRLIGQKSVASPPADNAFYIYKDIDYTGNHFTPSGYMGDIGDLTMNEAFTDKPHSGKTCIQVIYAAKGAGPNECNYRPPCKWAGVYWQEPPNNWGKDKFWKDRGFDLSAYKRLVFWARAEKNCRVEFKVGGIVNPYGDSLKYPRSAIANLTPGWQEFTIDLSDADLTHIIGGFVWVTNWNTNHEGATFYLDDIRFEK